MTLSIYAHFTCFGFLKYFTVIWGDLSHLLLGSFENKLPSSGSNHWVKQQCHTNAGFGNCNYRRYFHRHSCSPVIPACLKLITVTVKKRACKCNPISVKLVFIWDVDYLSFLCWYMTWVISLSWTPVALFCSQKSCLEDKMWRSRAGVLILNSGMESLCVKCLCRRARSCWKLHDSHTHPDAVPIHSWLPCKTHRISLGTEDRIPLSREKDTYMQRYHMHWSVWQTDFYRDQRQRARCGL